jgi:hypothetical protein
MWKEAVVTYFKMPSRHLPAWSEKVRKISESGAGFQDEV